jgi:acetyltransferase-like isoleucine patch superfamily enzyme
VNLVHHLVRRPLGRARRVWLRSRFARLGKGSVVGWPIDVLTRPDRISIGDEVFIRPHVRLEAVRAVPEAEPGTIAIGRRAHFEGYCSISAASFVTIGANVLVGANVAIRDHDHGFSLEDVHPLELPLKSAAVSIGDYSWLGQNVVVLKGVQIGAHAVIGANSVVTRSVPSGAVMAGIPARQIGWVDGRMLNPPDRDEGDVE